MSSPDTTVGGDPSAAGDDRAASRRRWLFAGQQLLRDGGLPAVKLLAMAEATGLTTGSFYHHFDNMGAFLHELARFHGDDRARELLGRLDPTAPPRERLDQLAQLTRDERMFPLDAAMRDWAGSDPVAAEAVRASDELLLAFLEAAFLELGFDRADARLRSVTMLSVGAARIHPPWSLPSDVGDRLLDLLTDRAPD